MLPPLMMAALLVLVSGSSRPRPPAAWSSTLPDGQRLLWLTDGAITAKQTSVTAPHSQDSMVLRQVTDGRRFVQLIYRGPPGHLVDCEQTGWRLEVARSLAPYPNSTLFIPPPDRSPDRTPDRSPDRSPDNSPDRSSDRSPIRFEAVAPSADDLRALDLDGLAEDCRANHRLARRRRKTRVRHHSRRRSKRGVQHYLMAPGTNWCGPSNRKTELGPFAEADRCCRRHDKCQAHIPGLARGHYVFNYRPFTVSHCRCDKRFRTCLKMANTGASNFVGKLFFNVVQRKCFVLRPGQVCVERSWWGKCLKMERKHIAHLIDNMKY